MFEQDKLRIERLSKLVYSEIDEPVFFTIEDLEEAVSLAGKYMDYYEKSIEDQVR